VPTNSLNDSLSLRQRIFRPIWWTTNLFLATAIIFVVYGAGWEYSVRQYLKGFSDAVVPASTTPEQKVRAILDWMRSGVPRTSANDPTTLSSRDPRTTLNNRKLLAVCGTATNAFLNLARSADLRVKRLLLLTPQRTAKHVVAEVLIDGRWVIADPGYRVLLRDLEGHLLTRAELRDPVIFAQATAEIANYPREYNYEDVAHVRLARLPIEGFHLRKLLDAISPGWEEAFDWSLLLERESFFVLLCALVITVLLLSFRLLLGWYADHRLNIPRFRLRQHVVQAADAFFRAPSI
jgi:transglutaminase superfamily protein